MNPFFTKMLWVANAAPQYANKREWFYPLKLELLEQFGDDDGWDLQIIIKDCWDCEGTGNAYWWQDNEKFEECDACWGTGEYARNSYYLLRYRVNGLLFHTPMSLREAGREGITPLNSQRNTIAGRIEHQNKLTSRQGLLAMTVLLLRYRSDVLFEFLLQGARSRAKRLWAKFVRIPLLFDLNRPF